MTRLIAAAFGLLSLAVVSLLLVNSRLASKASIAEREVAELRLSIERNEDVRTADMLLFKAQNATIQALDKKIMELKAYVADLSDRDAECLSPDDTERLRSLWTD